MLYDIDISIDDTQTQTAISKPANSNSKPSKFLAINLSLETIKQNTFDLFNTTEFHKTCMKSFNEENNNECKCIVKVQRQTDEVIFHGKNIQRILDELKEKSGVYIQLYVSAYDRAVHDFKETFDQFKFVLNNNNNNNPTETKTNQDVVGSIEIEIFQLLNKFSTNEQCHKNVADLEHRNDSYEYKTTKHGLRRRCLAVVIIIGICSTIIVPIIFTKLV